MEKENTALCPAEPAKNNLGIVTGPRYRGFDLPPHAVDYYNYMRNDIRDIKNNYIKLGFHLYDFDRCMDYCALGFSSTADFAEANLGMDKSAVSRCISVYKTFSNNGKCFIDYKWKEYSYSCLCEMVSMDEETRSLVTPDMTVSQIRELKKSKKKPEAVSPVAISQQTEEKPVFDVKKFSSLYGAARNSYVKNADSLESVVLHVYDSKGRPVFDFFNVWVDFLCFARPSSDCGKYLVIRLTHPYPFSNDNDDEETVEKK